MANKRTAELSRTRSGASSATTRSEASNNSIFTRHPSYTTDMSDLASSASGSKASSPDTTKSQIDFQFLNFSHPSDAKASRARRTVRSHVTRQQHAREQQSRAQSYHGRASEPAGLTPPFRRHAETIPSEQPTSTEHPGSSNATLSLVSSPEDSSPSPSPTVSPTYPPESRVDPADVYPDAWLPHIPRVMVCYVLDSYASILLTTMNRKAIYRTS